MKFYGELLVFVLLFITNLRVFFVHHVRRDPLVVLAPFTFIVAIFQILAWGIDVFTVLGLLDKTTTLSDKVIASDIS